MHIGQIVGIGPDATDFFYRYLISSLARAWTLAVFYVQASVIAVMRGVLATLVAQSCPKGDQEIGVSVR